MKIDKICILGYGNIGKTVYNLLATMLNSRALHFTIFDENPADITFSDSDRFSIHSFTLYENGDATSNTKLEELVKNNDLVINCLPYLFNSKVVNLCSKYNKHYFGLTEDYKSLPDWKSDALFLPQCGLAPGMVSIIAKELMTKFNVAHNVKLRVGALPRFTSTKLKYAWTWNPHGLVNEYYKPAIILQRGQQATVQSLTGLENVYIDAQKYDAFHTSGGIGTLAETYENAYSGMNIDYKTLRYPGHYDYIHFMKTDLQMSPEVMQKHLLEILPTTKQDVVVLYVYVDGFKDEKFQQDVYIKKFYPMYIGNNLHTAISYTTAFGVVGIIELLISGQLEDKTGHVKQEEIKFDKFCQTKCGRYFRMTPPEEFDTFVI